MQNSRAYPGGQGILASPVIRGALAGALGGLVLTSMFLHAKGASLHRYVGMRGNPVLGYFIVWILAIGIGAAFGKIFGARAARDAGYALGWGLLIGLIWFLLASCLILPPLRHVRPFSFSPDVTGELLQYLVYGLLLGMGYFQLSELAGAPSLGAAGRGQRVRPAPAQPQRRTTAPQPQRKVADATTAVSEATSTAPTGAEPSAAKATAPKTSGAPSSQVVTRRAPVRTEPRRTGGPSTGSKNTSGKRSGR
jgi:hypothetical protein